MRARPRPPARILCLGEVAWDLAPERGASLVDTRSLRITPGGASANAARALADVGDHALVCAAVGDDPLGRGLVARLAALGVDVSLIGRARARTALVFVERPPAPGAQAQPGPRAVSYRDPAGEIAGLAGHVRAIGGARGVLARARADALVVGTIACADAAAPLFAACARAARRAGAIVAIDVNARPRLWRAIGAPQRAIALVELADVVKASVDDLAVIGLPPRDLAARLRHGATLVVTDGPRPARAIGPFGEVAVAPRRALPSDAAGAGDAFVAGLVRALVASRRAADDDHRWSVALAAAHEIAGRWVAGARRRAR